jgi:TonB family protein
MKTEKEAVSLSKQKAPPAKATPSKEELSHLEARLRDMKKKTEYLDVSQNKSSPGPEKWGTGGSGGGSGGLPGSGEGGGRPLDPASQQYMLGVWEKIKNAWGLPGMSKYSKNLETVVTIRIRKDGRIVDINIEKRSGNRVYDESILRVLRSVDPLPPIPSSLNTDSLEIGFRFLPGDLS